jgi:hypothetical protein
MTSLLQPHACKELTKVAIIRCSNRLMMTQAEPTSFPKNVDRESADRSSITELYPYSQGVIESARFCQHMEP